MVLLLKRLVFIIVMFAVPCVSQADTVIKNIRNSDLSDYSRFVIELDGNSVYEAFELNNPPRIVIDIAKARWQADEFKATEKSRINNVRHSQKKTGVRIVLDANQPLKIKKHFALDKTEEQNYRLVFDFEPVVDELDAFLNPVIPTPVTRSVAIQPQAPTPVPKVQRKPLIVIDAGHGGHDPGTIGRRGTREKDITLSYSKELRDELLRTGRYRVYMTRDYDKYIKLRERVQKGRNVKGDLFISIHANAHKNSKTEGFSVYSLSETASDKEAAALARKENKAGLINGVDLHEAEDDITALLIDMTQRETKNLSASFAETLVSKAEHEVKLLRNPHRFAGFRVLTGADIPSVLIELGYLTNRREEKLLKSKNYKNKLAKTIVKAIDIHFSKFPVK